MRANHLAYITAKHPSSQKTFLFVRNDPFLFDGQCADTSGRVNGPVRPDAPCWAGINAALAGTAKVAGVRRVNRQRQVGQDFGQEEIGAGALDDQTGVFTGDPDPRPGRKGTFQDGAGVHIAF